MGLAAHLRQLVYWSACSELPPFCGRVYWILRATLFITLIDSFFSILRTLDKIDRINSAMDQSSFQFHS